MVRTTGKSGIVGRQEEALLVGLLKKRDKKGIASLYDQYSPALYGVILRIVKNEELAQDVLQDSFIKFWKKIDSYDQKKGTLFTWMLNIARNTSIDVIRSNSYKLIDKIQTLDNFVSSNEGPYTHPSDDKMDLDRAMKNLNPDLKEVIDMVYFEGYTHMDAAKTLNLPLGTVKSRVRIGIRELKKVVTR